MILRIAGLLQRVLYGRYGCFVVQSCSPLYKRSSCFPILWFFGFHMLFFGLSACSVSLRSRDSTPGAEQAAAAFYGAAQTELRSSVEWSGVERFQTGPKYVVWGFTTFAEPLFWWVSWDSCSVFISSIFHEMKLGATLLNSKNTTVAYFLTSKLFASYKAEQVKCRCRVWHV
jgi:hypothetical protein